MTNIIERIIENRAKRKDFKSDIFAKHFRLISILKSKIVNLQSKISCQEIYN